MPFSNPGSEMLTYSKDPSGLITEATIPNGTPQTTANIFQKGAFVTCLEDGKVYRMNGTVAVPTWEDISTISSNEMDENLLKVVQVSLSAADIIAMYATPKVVVPAIAGKIIDVMSVDLVITRTATAFTGGGVVNVQYDSTANGAGTTLHADIAATVVTGAAGTTKTHRVPKDLSDLASSGLVGKGLYISNKTAAFAAGTGTAVLTVRYYAL